MNLVGLSLWTGFLMAEKKWLDSFDLGSPEDFDPEEDTIWDRIFETLEDIITKSNLNGKFGGCYHISSDNAEKIMNTNIYDIKPFYLKAESEFKEKFPYELGVHAKFSDAFNPLGKNYHTQFALDMKYSKEIGATSIVYHPPYNPSYEHDKFTEFFIDDITKDDIIEILENSNIIIAWENMVSGQYSSPAQLLKFRERLKIRLEKMGKTDLINQHQFCLDTGHLLLRKYQCVHPEFVQKEIEEYLPKFAEFIKVFHIHSNDGTSDHHLIPFAEKQIEMTKKHVNPQKFMENSEEVLNWLKICEENKNMDNQHVHIEEQCPFIQEQVYNFYLKYTAKLGI